MKTFQRVVYDLKTLKWVSLERWHLRTGSMTISWKNVKFNRINIFVLLPCENLIYGELDYPKKSSVIRILDIFEMGKITHSEPKMSNYIWFGLKLTQKCPIYRENGPVSNIFSKKWKFHWEPHMPNFSWFDWRKTLQ